jgi:hypothetical protein
MDKKPEQSKLFEIKQENKVLSEEEIKNSADKKTGQLKFISAEIQIQKLVKDVVLPILEEKYDKQINELKETNEEIKESNKLLSEKSERLSNSLERMIPHLENKSIGNEKEAQHVWCENPENADIANVTTTGPTELVYPFFANHLASCFGCLSRTVRYLLDDLGLWGDKNYCWKENNGVSSRWRFKKAIVDEVYSGLEDLINSGKIKEHPKRYRLEQAYKHMKFLRS